MNFRPRREGELHGVDYFFVSKAQFEEWLAAGQLLEHAVVYGDYKGIPRQQVWGALCKRFCNDLSFPALPLQEISHQQQSN